MAIIGAERYLLMAEAYGAAADSVLAVGEEKTQAPFYMLVAHAIELALKSLLLAHGDDAELMILMGHNLDSCLRRAVRLGLVHDVSDIEAVVESLAEPHAAQSFRYPGFALRDLPKPDDALAASFQITQVARARMGD